MNKHAAQGIVDALHRFKVANAAPPGILDRLKSFGSGQMGAAKDLFHNMRGGLGGQPNPNLAGVGNLAEGAMGPVPDMGQLQRRRAVGNLKTLAPSMAIAGGGYMLHRHHQQAQAQEQEARQRAMMMQQGYGQPM
jgi:hypothetical protein